MNISNTASYFCQLGSLKITSFFWLWEKLSIIFTFISYSYLFWELALKVLKLLIFRSLILDPTCYFHIPMCKTGVKIVYHLSGWHKEKTHGKWFNIVSAQCVEQTAHFQYLLLLLYVLLLLWCVANISPQFFVSKIYSFFH